MKPKFIIPTLIAFFLSLKLVLAIDILDTILRPFGGINVGTIYLRYASFIDAVIYLVLFLGLSQFVLTQVYGTKKEGKAVSVAVALALTFAMTVLELRTGFNLGKLFPIAAIVFLVVFSMLLFNLLKALFNSPKTALCFTILIMFGFLVSAFNVLYSWMMTSAPLLIALIHISLIGAFICALLETFTLFKGDGKDDDEKPTKDPDEKRPEEKKPESKDPPPQDGFEVALLNPAPGSSHPPGEEIPIVFHVAPAGSNSPKRFDYDIILDTDPFYAQSGASPGDITPRKAIPKDLSIGPHKMYINTYPPGKKNNIGKTGEETFYIEKTTKNCKVEITAPVQSKQTAKIPYGQTIIFGFKAINIKTPYEYSWKIMDENAPNHKVVGGDNKRTSSNPEVTIKNINTSTYLKPLNMLPNGTYIIHVEVKDPEDGQTYDDAIRVVIGGSSKNNMIVIDNPTGSKSPYPGTPIGVEFHVDGPYHDAKKEFIYSFFVKDDAGRPVDADKGKNVDKKVKHHRDIKSLPPGKYTIEVYTGDPATKSAIAQPAKETFTVEKKGGGGGGGGGQRGRGEFFITVNGVSGPNGQNFKTDLPINGKISVRIQNVGKGKTANLRWRLQTADWIKTSKDDHRLKPGEYDDLEISIDLKKYNDLPDPKPQIAQLMIYGGNPTFKTRYARSLIQINII